ncbi:MAG: hypothetical protein ACFBQW_01680 [Sphingomonadaceae bacterium]
MNEDEPHIGKTEARGGTTPHMGRYILAVSLFLAIALFAVLLLIIG